MKKRIASLILILFCLSLLTGCCLSHQWQDATCETPKTCAKCGETEGESLGHSWTDATCTAPRTCSVCQKTEGEALGHSWVDATTEAPKTCTLCAATEGERIITDPRFTTAATKDIQGTWVIETPYESLRQYSSSDIAMLLTLKLGSDGTAEFTLGINDVDAYMAAMRPALIDTYYADGEANGFSREEIDQSMQSIYGMTVAEYVDSQILGSVDPAALEGVSVTGVYYVDGGAIYSGNDWDSEFVSMNYTFAGDQLSLNLDMLGREESLVFTRTAE